MCRLLCSVIGIRAATAQRSPLWKYSFLESVSVKDKTWWNMRNFSFPQTIPKKDLTNEVKSETKNKMHHNPDLWPIEFLRGNLV